MAEQHLGMRVGVGATDRTCPSCGQNDQGISASHEPGSDPRHIVLGNAITQQQATLADGTAVAVNVPVDHAYHLDCHAAMGCDHCTDLLVHNDGSVKGKVGQVMAPPHLHQQDITEHFEMQPGTGVLRRTDAGHEHLRSFENGE